MHDFRFIDYLPTSELGLLWRRSATTKVQSCWCKLHCASLWSDSL